MIKTWISTKRAMRTNDNPLVKNALQKGSIGFVHELPVNWTMQDVYEAKIALKWQQRLARYNIPVIFTYDIDAFQPISYEKETYVTMLVPYDEVNTASGKPYKKFTPFYKKARTREFFLPHSPIEWKTQDTSDVTESDDWSFPHWSEQLSYPATTEQEALNYVQKLSLNDYEKNRDMIERSVVTRLSPFIATGLLTTRTIVEKGLTEEAFIRQLIWREFAYMTAMHAPNVATEPLDEKFRSFPWRQDEDDFRAWCRGETGYPIVDAAMRELRATGYIHNRLRMIVASFLTKHLRIDWTWGAQYFMDTLLDADEAVNALNWQWVAGVGVDSSPYFRIFNPMKQSKDYAPSGEYIRTWCPDATNVHEHRPDAIVEHTAAREETLRVYHEWKNMQKS